MYNNKAIRRVVRAGRRSTIGNRVTGYNLFEGSNPLLSAKNEKAVPQGMAFYFFICKGFEQGGSRLVFGRKQSCGLFSPTRSRSIATRRHTAVCRKNPLLSAKNEKAVPQGMAFYFFICKGFEQGGSRLVFGRKQSCGLFSPTRSRSIATRRHTAVCRKNPLLINNCLLQYKNGQTIRLSARFVICFKYRRC